MKVIWGVVLILFTLLLSWLAQVINALWPVLAARLGLTESESDVDPTFYLDTRGEAIWDALIVWTLPVAGLLLILNSPVWAYFGLVGGGMYLYFSGRGIVVRLMMQRHGLRIGKPGVVKLVYVFLILYGVIAVITIIMAAVALSVS